MAALAWFALYPTPNVFGVTPPPDGGYPNFNTAEGDFALQHVTDGALNTAVGYQALYEDTGGSYNTATGEDALYGNYTGNNNTATGYSALSSNYTASDNTAHGFEALTSNSTGSNNTAVGSGALHSNTTGFNNTATGFQALYNTTYMNGTYGFNNTANGTNALFSDTTGFNNTATGFTALQNNTTGNSNTADGDGALASNTIGNSNTACGISALSNNTTGKSNIALGATAGSNVTAGSNNIDIGNTGVSGDTKKIRIGKQGTQVGTFIAGIFNVNEGGTIKPVYVNSNGQLGTQPPASSRRFKKEITPMDQTSEAILKLKPVTFRYKNDAEETPQYGLIAEEVSKVDPGLVIRDENGDIYTVRYEAVNAMLLNEFLKEHRQVQDLKAAAAKQEVTIERQQKQIEALAAGLEKITARVEAANSRRVVVTDN